MDYVRLFLVTMVLLLSIIPASAQSTEFTYQGRLLSGEVPANGAHDFEFLLWDEIAAGNQIGSTVTLTSVNVNNGVFSVRIDFGNQFPGANRFLEIKVRQSGTGAPFSPLNPRQAISSSPYAIKSINAENAASAEHATNANQLGGVAAGQFVVTNDPRMTDARQPLPNNGNYIQNSTTQQGASNFNIAGTGKAGVLDASVYNIGGTRILGVNPGTQNIFAGIFSGFQLTSGNFNSFFGYSAGQNTTTGRSNSFFGSFAGTANSSGSLNSFFGDAAGGTNTFGSANAFYGAFAGSGNTSGSQNAFFGEQAGRSNTTALGNSFIGRLAGYATTSGGGNTFIGYQSGLSNLTGSNNTLLGSDSQLGSDVLVNATAIGHRAFVSQSNSLVLGSINGLNGATADTRVGIGTTTPSARLHVGGSSSAVTTPVAIIQSGGNQIPLSFNSSGTEVARVRADSSGNLVLATVGGASKDIYFRAGDDSSTPRLFIDGTTGNVGIGTTNPLSNLSVTGSVSISNLLTIGNLDGSSSMHLCRSSVDAVAACTSSIRYKKNVVTLTSGLDLIRKLRPVTFNWKTNNGAEIGLIAEEVAKIEPRLTFNNSKGEVEGVNYDSVGVVVVNAVNELQMEIEAQRDRIRRLEAQVDVLTRLLCAQNPSAEFCGPKK